jgi:hypothetical protein
MLPRLALVAVAIVARTLTHITVGHITASLTPVLMWEHFSQTPLVDRRKQWDLTLIRKNTKI